MKTIRLFEPLMSSTVQVATKASQDSYGAPTYNPPTTYKAHIARRRKLVLGKDGQQVVSEQAIYLNAAPVIEPTAQITLSTGDVGSTESYAIHPIILGVDVAFDQKGPHHTVLYV